VLNERKSSHGLLENDHAERRTSKRVNEVVDKMRLPAVVRLSRSF
jgi:hypothetical protein